MRIKILMGIPPPGITGGPATHLPFLVEYFQNHPEFIIRTFYYGSKKPNGESKFAKIVNTSKTFFQFIKSVLLYRPDVIHINTAFDKKSLVRDVPFSLVCSLFSKPLFFKIHGSHYDLLMTKELKYLKLIKLFFNGASKVGVLSEYERQEFIKQFGNANKITVVKNIVPATTSLEQTYPSRSIEKKYDVLFVSRIEGGKGLEDLLFAIPEVVKSYPHLSVAIAGSGSKLVECKSLVEKLEIRKIVSFLGYVRNEKLSEAFNNSRIFVFPSHFPEGMPMAMIDAMRHGLPIITTRTRFAVSYLTEGENVFFVDRNNTRALSNTILHLLNSKNIFAKMRVKNYEFLNKFSQSRVGDEYALIFKQLKSAD